MSESCTFCDIADGTEPAYRVYEDEATLAFLDVNAVNDGHTLVVPKEHAPTLSAADGESVAAVFRTVRRVGRAVDRALEPDGYNVFQSNGAAAGQDVFHLHAHVVPRWEGDGIHFAPSRERIDSERGERVAGTLREAIQ